MKGITEVVAAKINGSMITNDLNEIVEAAKQGRASAYYDRNQMQFMAACDLGEKWKTLTKSKTLFYIVDGTPMFRPYDVVKK